jgi:hypothetical protein
MFSALLNVTEVNAVVIFNSVMIVNGGGGVGKPFSRNQFLLTLDHNMASHDCAGKDQQQL